MNTLPELSPLPGTEPTLPATPTAEEAPLPLEEPSTALPESLNSSNALDVSQPADTALPPTQGNPGEVLPPGVQTPPTVGNSPADGPLEVIPPTELQPPVIPPINPGTPDPVGEVTPPVGWVPEEDDGAVTSFGIVICERTTGACAPRGTDPDDVDEYFNELHSRQQSELAGLPSAVQEKIAILNALLPLNLDDAELIKAVDDMYKVIDNGLVPNQKLEVINQTALLAAEGKLNGQNVGDYLQFLDKVVVPQNTLYVQSATWALPTAGGFALADGPLPVGDLIALGLIGYVALTDGQQLYDAWSIILQSQISPVPAIVDMNVYINEVVSTYNRTKQKIPLNLDTSAVITSFAT